MVEVGPERFEELVGEALDGIPEELGRLMDNVVVQVREGSPLGLLGLYEGIPLTERQDYGGLAMPDRITVYRRPICRRCASEAQVVEEVRVTVIHEVAHHFGIDDARLDELGWA
ncbi:MAG TPA: metallopeptidase family protein [Acidimicrobiales bacterium]|jgi:predicted Zn-dependent protease with MMP-like domain|nr:metallopeptidase family protein [Acidimicrobiales bacterium]